LYLWEEVREGIENGKKADMFTCVSAFFSYLKTFR